MKIFQRYLAISDSSPVETARPHQFSLTSLLALIAAAAVLIWLFVSVYPFGPLLAWFGAASLVAKFALKIQNRPLGFACAMMFAVGILAIPYFAIQGHCVSPYQLKRIHAGATTTDVISILGKPSSIEHGASGDDWRYSGRTWCLVTISFDSDGIVEAVEHDH